MFGVMTVYATSPEGGWTEGLMGMLPMLLLMFAVFYFMIIRPQRRKDKAHKEMLASLKVTDEVVSIGGLHGKVVRIKDETYLLETGIGTQKSFIQIDRSAIARVTKEGSGKKTIEPTPIFDDEVEDTEE